MPLCVLCSGFRLCGTAMLGAYGGASPLAEGRLGWPDIKEVRKDGFMQPEVAETDGDLVALGPDGTPLDGKNGRPRVIVQTMCPLRQEEAVDIHKDANDAVSWVLSKPEGSSVYTVQAYSTKMLWAYIATSDSDVFRDPFSKTMRDELRQRRVNRRLVLRDADGSLAEETENYVGRQSDPIGAVTFGKALRVIAMNYPSKPMTVALAAAVRMATFPNRISVLVDVAGTMEGGDMALLAESSGNHQWGMLAGFLLRLKEVRPDSVATDMLGVVEQNLKDFVLEYFSPSSNSHTRLINALRALLSVYDTANRERLIGQLAAFKRDTGVYAKFIRQISVRGPVPFIDETHAAEEYGKTLAPGVGSDVILRGLERIVIDAHTLDKDTASMCGAIYGAVQTAMYPDAVEIFMDISEQYDGCDEWLVQGIVESGRPVADIYNFILMFAARRRLTQHVAYTTLHALSVMLKTRFREEDIGVLTKVLRVLLEASPPQEREALLKRTLDQLSLDRPDDTGFVRTLGREFHSIRV